MGGEVEVDVGAAVAGVPFFDVAALADEAGAGGEEGLAGSRGQPLANLRVIQQTDQLIDLGLLWCSTLS